MIELSQIFNQKSKVTTTDEFYKKANFLKIKFKKTATIACAVPIAIMLIGSMVIPLFVDPLILKGHLLNNNYLIRINGFFMIFLSLYLYIKTNKYSLLILFLCLGFYLFFLSSNFILFRGNYMKKYIILLTIFLMPTFVLAEGNTSIESFSKAKKLLLKSVYFDHRKTFYCDCPFNLKKQIIPSNNFSPATKHFKRSKKIEWEHVVPAHAFGQSFFEWKSGDPQCINKNGKAFKGRKCTEKVNKQFRYMQADIYNLVPANGQINALRSNYSFAMIPGENRIFGNCDFEIENRKAEPKPDIRGDIARIYFYMNEMYPNRGIISKKNIKLFQSWDKIDPVDEWERIRAKRIEALQGNTNPFIK